MAPVSTIDTTLGAIQVGTFISCMLYGVLSAQLYTYSSKCKRDPTWLIALVVGVWILETVHTVLSMCYVYDLTITRFNDIASAASAPWSLDVSVTLQGFVGAVVQSYFAYRVWKVSQSLVFPVIAWAGAFVRFAMTITITALTWKTQNIEVFSHEYGWTVVVSLSVSTAADILNAAALTWFLSSRKTDFKTTSRMVDKIIAFSIETGLITSLTAITMLITRVAMKGNLVWIGLFQIYAKMYSNSLMGSLNARVGMQEKHMKDGAATSSASSGHANVHANVRSRARDRAGINIQMVSFTETGDPGQKPEDDYDSTHTEMDVPYKG